MALTHTPELDSNFHCPDFSLPGVDGLRHSRQEFEGSAGLLVMFICNHCPYVKAIEDRLIKLGEFVKTRDLKMVAICANDAENYPEDSFANLQKRWTEKNYPFHYLYDESQEVAKSFGAVCTPDFFLFDRNLKLAYRGRLDDSWKEPEKVTTEELKAAMEALLQGEAINSKQVPSMGCNIKWKKS
jgi:thiol-disulfide isomerase/thioredoxin